MAENRNPDHLRAAVASAQRQVDAEASKHNQTPRLRRRIRPALILWAVLLVLAILRYESLLGEAGLPRQAEMDAKVRGVLEHAALDIETYREHFGKLPERVPLQFLDGVLAYQQNGEAYSITAEIGGNRYELEVDESGNEKFTAQKNS